MMFFDLVSHLFCPQPRASGNPAIGRDGRLLVRSTLAAYYGSCRVAAERISLCITPTRRLLCCLRIASSLFHPTASNQPLIYSSPTKLGAKQPTRSLIAPTTVELD